MLGSGAIPISSLLERQEATRHDPRPGMGRDDGDLCLLGLSGEPLPRVATLSVDHQDGRVEPTLVDRDDDVRAALRGGAA